MSFVVSRRSRLGESFFDDLLARLHSDLQEAGLPVSADRLVFACMESLSVAGVARPTQEQMLDRAQGAEHLAALVAAGCPVIDVWGKGWLPGRRYLVLLAHANASGADKSIISVGPELRGTVWPLSAAWFERLEVYPVARPLLHRLARRWWRTSADIPVRPCWAIHAPAGEQGCPTVPIPSPRRDAPPRRTVDP